MIGPVLLVQITQQSQSQVEALFAACFGSDPDKSWYEWKYTGDSDFKGLALGILEGDRLQAYYAGFPRLLVSRSQQIAALQIGDVMIHPAARGGLARNNRFAQLTRGFFSRYLGSSGVVENPNTFKVAFGFPNTRHLRQGALQACYRAADPMFELTWDIEKTISGSMETISSTRGFQVERLEDSSEVNALDFDELAYQALQEITSDGTWAVKRSFSYWQWRFPKTRSYVWWTFKAAGSQVLSGAGVLKTIDASGEELELLDWIVLKGCEFDFMQCLLIELGRQGVRRLRTWASQSSRDYFLSIQGKFKGASLLPAIESLPFCMALSVFPDPHASSPLSSGCWMLSGDTDFR